MRPSLASPNCHSGMYMYLKAKLKEISVYPPHPHHPKCYFKTLINVNIGVSTRNLGNDFN